MKSVKWNRTLLLPRKNSLCLTNLWIYEFANLSKQENCEIKCYAKLNKKKSVSVHNCAKNRTICQHYSICETDNETSRCVCPTDCAKVGVH